MLIKYLNELDDIILSAEEIVNIEILRKELWDTGLEKIAIYRYRIYFHNNNLLEMTERLIEKEEHLERTKYRYHWQAAGGTLIKRWDNARHHPEIGTFPHHLHDGQEEHVLPHNEISGLQVLKSILKTISY